MDNRMRTPITPEQRAQIEAGRQIVHPEWRIAQEAIKQETREMRAMMEHINDLVDSGVIDIGGFRFVITPEDAPAPKPHVPSEIERMGEAMARKWEEEG